MAFDDILPETAFTVKRVEMSECTVKIAVDTKELQKQCFRTRWRLRIFAWLVEAFLRVLRIERTIHIPITIEQS